MSYRVEVVPRAVAQMRRLDTTARLRLQAVVELLAEQPRPSRAEQIAGGGGEWRVRTGDLRLVYNIDDATELVRVVAVGRPFRAIPRAPRLTVPPPEAERAAGDVPRSDSPAERAQSSPDGSTEPRLLLDASDGDGHEGVDDEHSVRNWFWRRPRH